MDNNNASPQEIYEILEQQKRLQEMRKKLVSVLDKVNQTINSITVNFKISFKYIQSKLYNFILG